MGLGSPPATSRASQSGQLCPGQPGMLPRDAPQGCCGSMLPCRGGLSTGACLHGDNPTVCAKRPDTKTPPGPLLRTKRSRAGESRSSAPSRTRGAVERLGQGQAQPQAVGKLGRVGRGAVQRPKRWPRGDGYPWGGGGNARDRAQRRWWGAGAGAVRQTWGRGSNPQLGHTEHSAPGFTPTPPSPAHPQGRPSFSLPRCLLWGRKSTHPQHRRGTPCCLKAHPSPVFTSKVQVLPHPRTGPRGVCLSRDTPFSRGGGQCQAEGFLTGAMRG